MNSDREILISHLDRVQTTGMGVDRIQRNLGLAGVDVVVWCKSRISDPRSVITRRGKNWYVAMDGVVITVNAYSYTIITAHPQKS